MIFSFSLQPNPRGSQIPLVPYSCDSWEETIYIRLANKTTTPAVSPVLTADIWNTSELPQLSKCSLACQVTFGLNLLGRGWLGTGQSPWVPQNCSLISTCMSARPPLHAPKLPVWETGVISHTIFGHWMCLQRAQLFPGSSIPILSQCVDFMFSVHVI